jgi:2-polyprenyl-3-methyl-5-hydroxy-6-metoxy-1,4-benzoquinol methylase
MSRKEMLTSGETAKRIIDIGCGKWAFAPDAKKNNAEVWGIELRKDIQKLRRRFCIKVGNCENILRTYPKNYFDVILILMMFY